MDAYWGRKVFLALSFLSSCSLIQPWTNTMMVNANSTSIYNISSSTGIASATSETDASAAISYNVSASPSTSTEMTSSQTQVAPSVSEVGMSSSTPDVASPTFALDPTTEKQRERNLAAIIGGVVGGVIFIIIIVAVVVLAVRLSKTVGDEKGTNNESKKRRSAILSLRHVLPLFSPPFDASDSADPNDAAVVLPENADFHAMGMEYRPKSKFDDQIRVNLEVDDEGQGTVENGFAPLASKFQDKEHLVDGILEGRFGILGPTTFTPQKSESDRNVVDNDDYADINDDKNANIHEDYAKVTKRCQPGDSAFDNALYGPINGVDNAGEEDDDDADSKDEKNPNIHEDYAKVTKRSQPGDSAFDNALYGPINGVDNVGEEEIHVTDETGSDESRTLENSKPGNLDMENKALNGYRAETLSPSGAAAAGDGGSPDGVNVEVTNDRESAMYAEIPAQE